MLLLREEANAKLEDTAESRLERRLTCQLEAVEKSAVLNNGLVAADMLGEKPPACWKWVFVVAENECGVCGALCGREWAPPACRADDREVLYVDERGVRVVLEREPTFCR